MVIPYALFVLFMAANSQFPPWGPPNPYYSPPQFEYSAGPFWFAKAEHHVTHHRHHK